MAGFDAGNVVEPLDYTLKPHVDKSGTVKEPTDQQIAAYLAGVQKLVRDFRGKLPDAMIAGGGDVGAMLTAVEDMDPEVAVKFNEELAALAAALCSGEPSQEDILAVPPRIRGKFMVWLQGEVMNPEAAAGGGSGQARTLRSVAAG